MYYEIINNKITIYRYNSSTTYDLSRKSYNNTSLTIAKHYIFKYNTIIRVKDGKVMERLYE